MECVIGTAVIFNFLFLTFHEGPKDNEIIRPMVWIYMVMFVELGDALLSRIFNKIDESLPDDDAIQSSETVNNNTPKPLLSLWDQFCDFSNHPVQCAKETIFLASKFCLSCILFFLVAKSDGMKQLDYTFVKVSLVIAPLMVIPAFSKRVMREWRRN